MKREQPQRHQDQPGDHEHRQPEQFRDERHEKKKHERSEIVGGAEEEANLNLAVVNVKSPILKTIINVVGILPELLRNPETAVTGFAGSLLL